MNSGSDKKLIEIQLAGKNPKLWESLRAKFVVKIEQVMDDLMDSIIDPVNKTTVRDEAEETISLALNSLKSKLQKPGIENQKLLVEIDEIYSKIGKTKEERRKMRAETESIEFDNTLRRLEFSIGSTKILFGTGENEEDALLITKQLDEWLELIQGLRKLK